MLQFSFNDILAEQSHLISFMVQFTALKLTVVPYDQSPCNPYYYDSLTTGHLQHILCQAIVENASREPQNSRTTQPSPTALKHNSHSSKSKRAPYAVKATSLYIKSQTAKDSKYEVTKKHNYENFIYSPTTTARAFQKEKTLRI